MFICVKETAVLGCRTVIMQFVNVPVHQAQKYNRGREICRTHGQAHCHAALLWATTLGSTRELLSAYRRTERDERGRTSSRKAWREIDTQELHAT